MDDGIAVGRVSFWNGAKCSVRPPDRNVRFPRTGLNDRLNQGRRMIAAMATPQPMRHPDRPPRHRGRLISGPIFQRRTISAAEGLSGGSRRGRIGRTPKRTPKCRSEKIRIRNRGSPCTPRRYAWRLNRWLGDGTSPSRRRRRRNQTRSSGPFDRRPIRPIPQSEVHPVPVAEPRRRPTPAIANHR